jgi:hypothetical protein
MSVEDVEGIVIQTSDDLSFLKVIEQKCKATNQQLRPSAHMHSVGIETGMSRSLRKRLNDTLRLLEAAHNPAQGSNRVRIAGSDSVRRRCVCSLLWRDETFQSS